MQTAYNAIRNQAALVDLSHYGRIEVHGDGAQPMLDYAVGANLEDLFEGRILNTLLARETGELLAIVWLLRFENHFLIICDEGNRTDVLIHLNEISSSYDAEIRDISSDTYDIAIMGPHAEEVVAEIFGDDLYSVAFQSWSEVEGAIAARYGTIGEYECHLIGPTLSKAKLRDRILTYDGEHALHEVDDSAHPILMTEMRNVRQDLHMAKGTSIFEAGIQWMIDFRKQQYCGKDSLESQKSQERTLGVLITAETTNIEQLISTPIRIENQNVGLVLCAYHSLMLEKAIIYAQIDSEFAWPGLSFTLGNNTIGVSISAPAFLTHSVINTIS